MERGRQRLDHPVVIAWLAASGDHADVVLSSRIRFARNVAGYAFTARARDGERLRLLAQVRDAAPHLPSLGGAAVLRMDEMNLTERQLLHERQDDLSSSRLDHQGVLLRLSHLRLILGSP